jgi:hypothetical protein
LRYHSEDAALLNSEFRVTPVVQHAAMPNLLAEVLHPECHWSHALDNEVDDGHLTDHVTVTPRNGDVV